MAHIKSHLFGLEIAAWSCEEKNSKGKKNETDEEEEEKEKWGNFHPESSDTLSFI